VVDDANIPENAAKDMSFDAAGWDRLLKRTEAAIVELESRKSGNPSAGAVYSQLGTAMRTVSAADATSTTLS